jgi:polyhydroxyalkanoate synthase
VPIETTELRAQTQDDVSLAITRLRDPDLPSRGAVIMQHGLASNGGCFVVPQQSFAGHLASLGYDAYVTELRNAGKSGRSKLEGFDAYIEQDLPALIAEVRRASGFERVSWIGHSMGGILALAYGIENPDAPFENVITVCSSLDYRHGTNVYQRLNRIRPLAKLLPFVPYGFLARMNALIAGAGPILGAEGMNFRRKNVEREVLRHVLKTGFEYIPIRLLDDLATTFDAHGFSRKAGEIRYHERAAGYRFRTLLIAGAGDVQCPPECVAATFALLSGATDKVAITLGTEHGHGDEYGHFDPFVGKRAREEVWPLIAQFLDGKPAAVAAASVGADARVIGGLAT